MGETFRRHRFETFGRSYVKNTIESLLKCSRVWRGLLECSSDLLSSSNPSPCRVNISASENVSDRALRLLCRSSSDENLKLSRLRIVRCVSEANMQACFATITMSKSDMLRITISNEYKQKRTALARFLTSWASSPSRRVTHLWKPLRKVERVCLIGNA